MLLAHPDRYMGIYSGGPWWAIRDSSHLESGTLRAMSLATIETSPEGSDGGAMDFWFDPPDWIAVGRTPNEAVEALDDQHMRDIGPSQRIGGNWKHDRLQYDMPVEDWLPPRKSRIREYPYPLVVVQGLLNEDRWPGKWLAINRDLDDEIVSELLSEGKSIAHWKMDGILPDFMGSGLTANLAVLDLMNRMAVENREHDRSG
jgi:hypothetical protein